MATPAKADLLFEGLPNEIGIAVLRKLDFYDLISAFFVSGLWAQTIDRDDVMRAKMFRLPKDFKKNEMERIEDFIDTLWEEVYRKADDDEDLWNWVDICPFFDNDKKACVGKQGACEIRSDRAFSIHRLSKITADHRPLLRQLCGSMLLTYPPVQCTKNCLQPPRRRRGRLLIPIRELPLPEPMFFFYHVGVVDSNGVTTLGLFDYIQGDDKAWKRNSMIPGVSRLRSRYVWFIAPKQDSEAT